MSDEDDRPTPVDFQGVTGDNQRALDEIVVIAENVLEEARELQIKYLRLRSVCLFLTGIEIIHIVLGFTLK